MKNNEDINNQLGDKHNFGRYVKPIFDPNFGKLLLKPRSILWEHLFFDKQSPILDCLKPHHPYFSNFFQLESVKIDNRESLQRILNEKKIDLPISKTHLFEFFDLCAYSLYFGLMDLNVENLFLTDQGLTVIDCETVFFNLQNLSATGLIPNRNMLYQCSGASKIFQGVTSISPDEIASFANRFIFSLDLLKSLEGPLIKKIYNSNSFLTTPIRVIFRDTYLYANLLARPSENYRLFEEEFKQLGKGDIPYFFFYLNDKNIYYYSNESYQTHPVSKEMMEFFHQKFSMELPSADFINNFQSDIETKKIKSLLEIVDFLLLFSTQKEEEFEVSLNGYQVQVEPSIITCTSKGSSHSIAMVRKYIDENDLDLEDTRLKEINKDFNFSLSKEPTIFITLS